MQSVGGVKVERPYREAGTVYLPVVCDVSGLQAVTVRPTTVNSGLVVRKVGVAVEGANLYIWVTTSLPHGSASAGCGAAALGHVPPGKYAVFYGKPPRWNRRSASGPNRIGDVEVEP